MRSFERMIRQRRLGFSVEERLSGRHQFVGGAGPDGDHPMALRLTCGTRHLGAWLNPLGRGFLACFLEGRISVGGLVEDAACRGSLDPRLREAGRLRYDLDFRGPDDRAFRFVGEKLGLRPWNLHRTQTTCYGTIIDQASGRDVSRSILTFHLGALPALLASVRFA